MPKDEVSRFATSFFITFLAVQLAAVFLLTPVITATAIAEEKERRRLDFLLVTELHDHEIVLGKLASRVATVGFTLLTGLPILGLMQFLGGVDPNLVLAGFAITLFTMLSVASVGMWMSSVCEKPINAILLTYLLVLGYLGLCWCGPGASLGHPAVLYLEIEANLGGEGKLREILLGRVLMYGAVHLLVSGLSLVLAMHCLRPERATPGLVARGVITSPSGKVFVPVPGPVGMPVPWGIIPPPPPTVSRVRPPIDEENPLLWKELYLDRGKIDEALQVLLAVTGLFLLFIVAMVCLTAILQAINEGQPIGTVTNPMARGFGSALGCFMLLGIVFTAVGTVSREREQHTLDSLLILPVDRREILRAKWLGSILSVRRLGVGLALIWGLALVTGGVHFLAVPLLVLVFLAHVAFAASLGLWFSVMSPSKVQATMWAALTLFGIMVASLVLGANAASTTPMVSLWNFAFSPQAPFLQPADSQVFQRYTDYRDANLDKLALGLAGAAGYAVASGVLSRWACARFRKEEGVSGGVEGE